ncbi:expressed unknown protein [Seminavis robusta]|uniref:G-protein coupled receptors family 1 profile domain-containing protein n=1 Tax=Seminavis robusta TaxID=568900 RepID=A0A9N8E100_9STRA|nr:expressed unknown protein [Seminavis robusta]|eukprot:Sro400_g135040.1 n/a (508) ;mRNA; r:15980-17503
MSLEADSGLPSEDISSLTDAQEKALYIIVIVSSLLSLWGSSNIIYMVLSSRKRSPYRRILLGLSCCDLVSSVALALQGFLLPSETSQRVWAFGNDASCSALGFFQQFAFSNTWYNGSLSLYFLLTVRFGVKEQQLARRVEPFMHILSIGYPLVTATIGAAMGVYNEFLIGMGCWVYDYPHGCGCNPGEDAVCCESIVIGWGFAGIPTLIISIVILTSNIMVYLHVRHTIRRSRAYLHSSVGASAGNQLNQQQSKRIKAVATQAFLYVVSFFLCFLPSVLLRSFEMRHFHAEDEDTLYPLLVVVSITLPLQGFLNVLIYARPSYLLARKDFPDQSRFWAFRRALHGDKVQPRNDVSHWHASISNVVSRSMGSTIKNTEVDQRRSRLIAEPQESKQSTLEASGDSAKPDSSAQFRQKGDLSGEEKQASGKMSPSFTTGDAGCATFPGGSAIETSNEYGGDEGEAVNGTSDIRENGLDVNDTSSPAAGEDTAARQSYDGSTTDSTWKNEK